MTNSGVSNAEHAIHDVIIRPLSGQAGSLALYRYSDHLLPRIGYIQYVATKPTDPSTLLLRENSDELWCLLSGACTFLWHDRREASPSKDVIQRYSAEAPLLVLAPFGVAFGHAADQPCQLIRIAAFAPNAEHPEQSLPWPAG